MRRVAEFGPPVACKSDIQASRLLQKGISRSMSVPAGFDFTRAMRLLCQDVAARLPQFAHLRMEQIAVTFAQTRRRVSHGLQAKLTPLRFEKGALVTRRSGRTWTVERLYEGDREMLYILTFYLPRFLDHTFREKLITVFHELYHISPGFDGDIRRMEGRYHVHSHSQQEYDREMDMFVEQYLHRSPPPELLEFLKSNFRGLCARHGAVVGKRLPTPKLIELPPAKSA
jgi:Putative phage metallopeptidase